MVAGFGDFGIVKNEAVNMICHSCWFPPSHYKLEFWTIVKRRAARILGLLKNLSSRIKALSTLNCGCILHPPFLSFGF